MSLKNTISLELSRIAFESWYATTKYDKHSQWHEDKQRFTVMTLKQYMWESWEASRRDYGRLES